MSTHAAAVILGQTIKNRIVLSCGRHIVEGEDDHANIKPPADKLRRMLLVGGLMRVHPDECGTFRKTANVLLNVDIFDAVKRRYQRAEWHCLSGNKKLLGIKHVFVATERGQLVAFAAPIDPANAKHGSNNMVRHAKP
jgi:hypothetical protein